MLLLFAIPLCILAQEKRKVSGRVTDATGEPLIGVNITIRDIPGLGTITDVNGRYTITMESYQRLVFSYIGYQTKEVLVKEESKVDVTMEEEVIDVLDEVVITGMGSKKKVTLTGAITTVDMNEIKLGSATTNLSNMLAGNIPGLMAMQTSGRPGETTTEFWIRGISTFGAGRGAYILVDGFERPNLDDINIEDIESFSVLKDASATAIYGSKGANGVILITTKKGKTGKISIDVKVASSYNKRTITPEFVDGPTYARLANEALITRNQSPLYQPEELELIQSGLDPDFYPNVNWMDILLRDGAWSHRANLNINGGGTTARYFLSGSYTEDQGMYKTDKNISKEYNTNANFRRYNYRMNVDIDITNTTLLKVGVSGTLAKRNHSSADGDIWASMFGYNALSTPIFYSNGYIPAYGQGGQTNPWVNSTMRGYNESWENNLQSNLTLEQNFDFITKGLRFIGRFGYDTYNSNWISRTRWPQQWKAIARDTSTGDIIWQEISGASDMHQGSGASGKRREFFEALLTWNRSFHEHNLSSTLRYTYDMLRKTVDIGDDLKNGIAETNIGLAGQVTYNWKNRYFFDFNFGYTGSENFAKQHRWGFFPAYSVAWNIAEEPIVKKALPWVSMFKLRYSHGKVGNDDTGERFPFLYTIEGGAGGKDYNFGTPSNPVRPGTLHYSQIASPNIGWEVATKDDVGVDIALFNDKFSLTVDYFREERSDIFMVRGYLPEITGLESAPKANVGKALSRGFDGNFSYRHRIGEVDLTVRGNFTYSKNEILERDEELKVYPYQYDRGYRIDQVRGLVALGLFKDYDDIRNSPKQTEWGNVMPGDIKYKDVNGDGVINGGDNVAIGATWKPNFIYGMGLSAAWKGFDINLLFQGAGKSTFNIGGKNVFAFSERSWGNIFKGMLDNRYIDQETADKLGIPANVNIYASYPRLSYGGNANNQQTSTFWMRNGSYLRLKNIDIGYTLPKELVNKIRLNNVRVYVTGTNLITWSDFKFWDPEMNSWNGEKYPLTKSFTIGLNINL